MLPLIDRPRDRSWGMDWQADRSAIAALGLPEFGSGRHERTLASLIAALGLAAETEVEWLSYSRSRDWYAAGHYEGTDASYTTVTTSVARLLAEGLVEEERARTGDHVRTGRQSRIRATDLMLERLDGHRFRHVPGPTLVMRDEDGNPMPMPRTERARRMQREVDEVNDWLAQLTVGISPAASPDDWQRTAHHLRARKVKDDKETWACTLPTPGNTVVRILGRGRYDCHGRLYGWWQGLPKARRGELLINGELLIEEDFAALHPTLLYASKGIRLDFDPYETDRYCRQHGKWALNVLINAASTKAAVDALMWKDGWEETRCYTELLVDEIAQRNEPIGEYLGSDAGVRLMGIDSAMALDVLKRCRKAGIEGVLPVHDSFLVLAKSGNQVRSIMHDVLDAARVRISGDKSITSSKTIRQIVSSSAEPASPSPGAQPRPVIPSAEPAEASPFLEPWPAYLPDAPCGAIPASPSAEPFPAPLIPEGLASLLAEQETASGFARPASLLAVPRPASLVSRPAPSCSPRDARSLPGPMPAARPSRGLAALRLSRDPVFVPEELGPRFEPNRRRRPDGISARCYEGRWFAIGRVPSEPEGGHEPPGGPVRPPRAAPGCAPYPSRPVEHWWLVRGRTAL